MKKLILLLFLFQICNSIYSQEREATIHFIDSTSMKGLAEIKRNKIFFRFTEDDEKSEWSYDFATGVTFSGYDFTERYEYIKPDKNSEPLLLEVLEEGTINVYRKNKIKKVYDYHGQTDSRFGVPSMTVTERMETKCYVKRPNEIYLTDLSLSFVSRSLKYFADCEIILKKIKDKTFHSGNIPEMVTYYNNYCYTEDEE